MPTISVTGSANRMLAYGTNDPGHCLEYQWWAEGRGNHYITGGAASAQATFDAAPMSAKHLDRNVPGDLPAFFGPRPGNALGDVIIAVPNSAFGLFVATDYPSAGVIGLVTLAGRERQTKRQFIGYLTNQGGYDLVGYTVAGGGDTPIPDEDESDMGLYGMYQRTDAGVTTYAVGVLDPNWRTPGHNFWAEAPASMWADFPAFFGTAKAIDVAFWNARSNDPNRIADLGKFPFFELVSAPAGGSIDLPAILAAVAKVPTAAQNGDAARAAIVKE
jgi:hypothetical protein